MAECLIACGDLIFWYIIGSFFHHLPSLPLNWFMLPLVTTASGSAFQSFTTLWLNVLRLTRLLHCVFCTLIVWPLVLTSLQGLKNFFSSILSMLFMILYVCITSALLRLYSSDGSFSSASLSEYSLFSIPSTSLVARCCTLSIFSLSFLYTGWATVMQYSTLGLTSVLYKFMNGLVSMCLKCLFISPNVEFAAATTLLICELFWQWCTIIEIGRPKRRFIDVVKEDMAEVEVTEEDTEDRNNWRWKIRCGDPWWEKPKRKRR